MDGDPPGRQGNSAALSGFGVGSFPIDFHRREVGRHLLNLPEKPTELLFNAFGGRKIGMGGNAAFDIQGVRLGTEAENRTVLLGLIPQQIGSFSELAGEGRQKSRGEGIQGAGVPNLSRPDAPLQCAQGGEARYTGGFVDKEYFRRGLGVPGGLGVGNSCFQVNG